MSEHDDQRTEQDSAETDEQQTGDSGDSDGDSTDVSSSGVELEGYESQNNPSEEREAIMQADSPDDVDDGLIKEIEEERKRRLDPENRPENTEVDNTKRVFVPAEAKFEDSDIDQDPSLGQEGLAPVGGDAGSGGGSDDSGDSEGSDDSDDSGDSEGSEGSAGDERDDPSASEDHVEPDVEEGDPKDESATVTSGTEDPTESDRAGSPVGGKHKA